MYSNIAVKHNFINNLADCSVSQCLWGLSPDFMKCGYKRVQICPSALISWGLFQILSIDFFQMQGKCLLEQVLWGFNPDFVKRRIWGQIFQISQNLESGLCSATFGVPHEIRGYKKIPDFVQIPDFVFLESGTALILWGVACSFQILLFPYTNVYLWVIHKVITHRCAEDYFLGLNFFTYFHQLHFSTGVSYAQD